SNTIKKGLKGWDISEKIAVYPEVEKISFDVLTPLLWGLKLDDNNPESFAGLPVASKAQVKALYKTYFDGFYGLVKLKSPLTAYGRGIQARAKLIELMRAVIKRKKKEEINPISDFLAMMLANQQDNPDGVFNDNLIENQCLLQLWASHYEISGLVSSLIYKLGQYPQLVKKLRQEQVEVKDKVEQKDIFSSENLKKMEFLEATIKEILRALPPSSTANRRLTKSVVVNGILYEKGCAVIAEPRLAHVMEEHFTEPEKFDPERFLAPRNEGKMYEFIPFGGGVHACLGAQMAMVVTKIFGSYLLDLFDWESIGEASFVQFPLKKLKDNYQINFQTYQSVS
ncbi:MAG: cytochrome P450, partial [Cyanobacteria bacterium P01_A01_bin.84]